MKIYDVNEIEFGMTRLSLNDNFVKTDDEPTRNEDIEPSHMEGKKTTRLYKLFQNYTCAELLMVFYRNIHHIVDRHVDTNKFATKSKFTTKNFIATCLVMFLFPDTTYHQISHTGRTITVFEKSFNGKVGYSENVNGRHCIATHVRGIVETKQDILHIITAYPFLPKLNLDPPFILDKDDC